MEKEQARENILPSTKSINLMELLPKAFIIEKETFKITPSEYIKEMSFSMEERHKRLYRISSNIKPSNWDYPPEIRIIPHVLIFQRFEAMSTNRLIVEVKNVGKTLLPVRMRCPNSIYFSANFVGPPVHRLAAGLSVEFEITFTPKEEKDYQHVLVFTCKEETFQIPIVAIGPRAMLDIPDQIILNPSPVRISTSKFIVVRNIGNAPAVFNFSPKGTHFQATPAKGILAAGDSMLLNISFESSKVEEVTETLQLSLETGEKFQIILHGSTENVSVRLEKNSVVHEDTFMGLNRGKTVRLINNSSSAIKFCWKKNKTAKEDLEIIERMKEKYAGLSELEKLKDARVIYYGLSSAEKHKLSCDRILQDELRLLDREEFKFSDDTFSIFPESGEVWPKGIVEMIISFEPKAAGTATAEAYLEVSGRDSRLPLRMKGSGLGPNIILNVKKIDIDFIFLCSLHKYEVLVENVGDIPGTIQYVEKPLVFGGRGEVFPLSYYLKPGEVAPFFVSFSSNRQGEFTEKFHFVISESGEKRDFVLKGKVVSPSLNVAFDIAMIDFGIAPLGIPVEREVNLHNLSVVPVKFSLRVTPDGDSPSISVDKFACFTIKPQLPQNPKEFRVDPEESVVEPFSSKKVTVILTANKEGRHNKQLVVDLWGAESGSESCAIKYTTKRGVLTVTPKSIVMPSCFINYPYTTQMVVKNSERVPGFFYICPQYRNSHEPVTISTSVCQGLLKPGSSMEIDVTIILNTLGKQFFSLNMLTFGHADVEEMCAFSCTCQGPVLAITPTYLNWGEASLLETVAKEVEISNESPIPAQVTLHLEKGKSFWNVTPVDFTIPPLKLEKITIELYLKDCGSYKGKLWVDVYNGKSSNVVLYATGVGYSLVMTPKLTPFYFLGTLFSKKTYEFEISIENMGSKMYSVIWSSSFDYKAVEKVSSKRYNGVFKMIPSNLDINSLEKVSVFLQANSESPGNFKQLFYCYGNLGTFTPKELLLTYEVSADFVEPMITCDKKHMHFMIRNGSEKDDSGTETKICDTVILYNTTTLPIEISVSITRPFCLLDELDSCITSLEHCLTGLDAKELKVKFNAVPKENKISKTYDGKLTVTLKDHSKTINILLTGKMSYPNISVQPKIIDFGYLEVGKNTYKDVRMLNTSPLTVHYNIKWNTIKSYVVPVGKSPSFESFVEECAADQYPADEGEAGECFEGEENREDESSQKGNLADASRTLVTPTKPELKMPEVEISDTDVKVALFPMTRNYYNCDDQLMEAYRLIQSHDTGNYKTEMNFTKFCDITPFYGTLDPHSAQILSVMFSSNSPVRLYVEAVIQVDSGPEEVLIIEAISSEVEFQLSTTELDFGKQLFCETKSQALILKNLAAMPFSFEAETESESGCEMEKDFPLGRGMMTVSPSSGIVGSFESVELIVRYHPGIPGKFESEFDLQIAYLDPCAIKVKGTGVFPQVYVALPRPEILKIDPEVGYFATASITPDWCLATGAVLQSLYCSSNSLKPYRSRESSVDGILEKDYGEETWELIGNDLNFLPSEVDIYLAIERVLAYNLIPMDTSKAIFAVYARTIPGFTVPAYDLDFGVCLAGIAVEQQIKIMNFGPLPVVIYGVFDPELKQKGIFFRLKNRNELKVCSCLSFTVSFNPKRTVYKKKHEKVETVFYFEIYHGPKIPIRIFAEVTYPHVIPSMTVIDFEEVVCGCCKVIYLRLKNPGFVAARWYISSKKKDDIKEDVIDETFFKPEGSMFYLDYYSGTLSPEEYCTVQVFFKPEYGDKFSAVLYVNVIKGREKIKILLSGSSVEPRLTISKNVLDFKSTLPFPYKAEKIFSICNPCPFPVEFYFPEFDEQILGEERILRAVILYYETTEILLPVRKPGETLPVELFDFYNILLDALNAKFIENEREKMLTEKESENFEGSTSSVHLNFEEDITGSNQSFAFERKKKKMKKFSRSKTAVGSSRDSIVPVSTSREPTVPPIFEQKSPEEIQDMLEEFITNGLNKDFTYDPVQAAIKNVLPPEKEEEYRDGTLIICCGAPYTNSILLANRLGLLTKMMVLSIDSIVLTEAAFARCEAGVVVRDLIEQTYSEYIQINERELVPYNAWEENEFLFSEGSHYDFDDTFNEIQRKFRALVELREKLLADKRKTGGAPSGSKSDTSRKVEKASAGKLQMDLNAPIANITEALVVDILRYRFSLEVEDGLIIEGLQSVLTTSATNALLTVLKAVGNVKDIIVIFFLNNYEQYRQNQLNLQAEQELLKYCFQEEVLQILEEEPVEVFENLNLSQEDADFFREQFLMRRREALSDFLVKKNAFYEVERLKREARNQGQSFHVPLNLTFDLPAGSDKKEKEKEREKESGKKKGAGKSLIASETDSRKSGSGTKSVKIVKPPDAIADSFLAFEMDMAEMKAIIDNWDQRLGALVIDSVSEAKTRKGQTPRKADSVPLNLPKGRRGIFSWLVDVSRPNSNSFLACCCYLKTTLQGRSKPSESDDWPLTSPQSLSFSVVPLPSKRIRNFPQDVFTITATENITLTGEDFCEEMYDYPATPPPSNPKLNRSLSSASLKSKSKESKSSRRRKTESRISIDARSQKSKKSEIQLKPRCTLPPGALQSYKVKYYPVEMGNWTHDYVINLVNWNAEGVVKCLGCCDIPQIDISPYNMFWNSSATGVKTSAFAQEQYCASHFFNFGQIIVSQSNSGKNPVGQFATFTFINISTLPVDMRIVFGEEGSSYDTSTSEYFLVEPNALWIMPGGKKEVNVRAIPSKVGVVWQCLMLIIKDNPKVECIKVMFEAVKASLTATPKVVNFDKLLLRRTEVRQLVLDNENSVSLYFVLRGLENLPEFSFSRVSGRILAKESVKLEITYHAMEAQIISEQPVEVLVYDSEDLKDVVQELHFNITAEAYDIALDIIFSNLDTDEVDFGDTRVEREYSVEFSLKNVGKYLLSYRFEIDSESLKNSGNTVLYCVPQEGKLIPGKLFPVTANFQADTEVSWKREPLIKILVMEPTLDDDLIATIPLQVTARSHFSRYEIRPFEELNFGHITVGATTTGYIKIENKGHFSLAYYLELFSSSYVLDEKGSAKTRKSSKMGSASKEKMDKGKKGMMMMMMMTTIKAGIFEISPCAGVVEVGQEVVISATCTPTEVGSYQDKIIIFVNESLPHLKKGNPLKISAEACVPVLDFEDHKSIFREHVVCNDEAELHCKCKTGPYTIYTVNSNLFSFKNVCVGKAAEARVYLQNVGMIDCSVKVSVANDEVEVQRSSALDKSPAGSSEYFRLAAEKLVIEPYTSCAILLTFKPDALEVYRAKLTVTLEMPEGYENIVQVFDLLGTGILPQIEITEPGARLPEGQALVNFPPTSPGRTSTASISFSNTGLLDCKVIVELYKPVHPGVFTLFPKPSTEKMLKIWELAKLIDHTVIVSLSPGEVAEFNVMFNPVEIQTYSSLVKLYIVDNPFENWCFKLTGEVFFEEVVIEKIRTSMPFLNGEEAVNDSKLAAPASPGQYFVNFGDCYVKKKSKVLLRLSNKTEKEYFKFEWEEAQNISISPAVGHLYPNSYKEILLVFQPEEPAELDYTTLSCTLNKILFGSPLGPPWDSRLVQYQKKLIGDTSARSIDKNSSSGSDGGLTSGKEPVHEVIPESSKVLYLNLSGIADYTRLTCETTKINFKDTFMFQTRVFPLVLENSGNVPLEYKLLLNSVTVWPLKENKKSHIDESLLRHYRSNSRPQSSQLHSRSDSGRLSDSGCTKRTRPATCVVMDFNEITHDKQQSTKSQSTEEETPSHFNPFTIENATGRILPREKACCDVKFSPMDINEFRTTITIQVASLHPECGLSEIEVTASSLMPYCHFDVPESDYLETGRREYSRPGPIGFCPGVPLPADIKTIEIKVLGVGITIPIKFHGINPTEDDYTFSWVNITQTQPDVIQSFHCSTLDGWIRAGRQQLMKFSFVSQKIGITESFWKFSIPKYGVETTFLFVGDVRQPAVCFLSNHLNLRPTLIGCTSTDDITVVNHEDKPFDFSFVPESLYSEGCQNVLQVTPRSGKILPNSEKTIRVIFTGKTPGKTLFNLKCKVNRMKEPFVIPVEVTTYAVQPMVTFEDFGGAKNYAELNKENLIDFGSELTPQIPKTITFTLISLSRTSYYYEWEYDENVLEARHCSLQFSGCQGHVASFSREKCGLTIMFTKKSSLVKFPLSLKIRRGPTFYFLITGCASPVICEFSFNHYDFGYCFLQEKDICFNEASLVVVNRNATEILLECNLAENTGFSYVLPQSFIYPSEHLIITLRFHPKDCILYEAVLTVTMNGNQERMIHLTGHGTEFKVGLADVEDTTISLGAVKVGKKSTRKFCLLNKSLAVATLLVGFSDQLPVNGECLARPEETDLDLRSEDHRLKAILTISPSTVFQIRPNETFPVEITFSPQHRSSPFSETVCLQYQEKAEPICLVTGCSLGAEISLDRNFLNFGAVVESCTSDLRLKIVNSGSIGARFVWNTESLTDYSISPTHGCCSAESDVTITVTFCPSAVQNYVEKSVECRFHLSESESYPSQWLNLIGDCVAMPEAKEVVRFQCFVRGKDTKEVTIDNTTGKEWQLIPIVSGEYFRGLDILVVPPLSTATYQVDYSPLTMTEEDEFHEGSVFFKPPNGQGLLYQFVGVALPPNPEETIERDVPCKTKYVELLKIKNWLQHPQRFKTNIISLEDLHDPTCTCTGFEYLEVPSLAQKEYSLNFFAYNVGVKKYQVKFINEESDEYIWYSFIFNVTMCGPLEVINLKSGVRQTCQHEIKLENPLSISVEYKLEVENPEVHYESDLYYVPPEQSVYATISFTPIHPGEKVVMLNASCAELGVFPRELRLTAIEEVPSNPRMFETPLGTSQTQEFVITNISNVNATFICKLYSDDFTVNEQGSVKAGQSTTVKVTYEPTEIGSTSATLFVESQQAGNFIFPLLGMSTKPMAKGPFILKPGSAITIPFKNVFNKTKEFHMHVDNQAFVLKTAHETLSAKEECKISVTFQKLKYLERLSEYQDAEIQTEFPMMGQLIVTCVNPFVKWQFYLKGIFEK